MEKTNKSGALWNVAISFGAVVLTSLVAWKTTSTTALAVSFFSGPLPVGEFGGAVALGSHRSRENGGAGNGCY